MASVVVVEQSSEAEVNEELRKEVAVADSREPAKVNSDRAKDNFSIREVAVVVVVEGSAGGTMTSHNAIETPPSQSVLAGP